MIEEAPVRGRHPWIRAWFRGVAAGAAQRPPPWPDSIPPAAAARPVDPDAREHDRSDTILLMRIPKANWTGVRGAPPLTAALWRDVKQFGN